MRYIVFIVLLLSISGLFWMSCAKYKDPAPKTDPRLTNPYCNDPAAVNYNEGFPGKPDNSVCYYPTDVFNGNYMFHDSIYRDTLFIRSDSFILTIAKQSNTKMTASGMCGSGNILTLTALPTFVANVDTTVGMNDTTVLHPGQILCRLQDTITGTITKDRIDSTLHISFTVVSDTGTTTHTGNAYLRK